MVEQPLSPEETYEAYEFRTEAPSKSTEEIRQVIESKMQCISAARRELARRGITSFWTVNGPSLDAKVVIIDGTSN